MPCILFGLLFFILVLRLGSIFAENFSLQRIMKILITIIQLADLDMALRFVALAAAKREHAPYNQENGNNQGNCLGQK